MTDRTCATCRFYKQTNAKGGYVVEGVFATPLEVGWGLCRKNPPQVIAPNPHFDDWFGKFPSVREDDWCGDFWMDTV